MHLKHYLNETVQVPWIEYFLINEFLRTETSLKKLLPNMLPWKMHKYLSNPLPAPEFVPLCRFLLFSQERVCRKILGIGKSWQWLKNQMEHHNVTLSIREVFLNNNIFINYSKLVWKFYFCLSNVWDWWSQWSLVGDCLDFGTKSIVK